MSLTDDAKSWILDQLADTNAKIERVETSLLTEFHKWASPRPGATTACATYPG